MPLDLSKLQNVHPTSDGWQCACPYCQQNGRDSGGNHLRVWKSGEWNCVVASGDKEHNRGIWKLAGDGNAGTTQQTDEPRQIDLKVPQVYPPSVLDRLIKDYSLWESKGISAETVIPFRGGIATQFTMKDRWVFPQFNERDEIIGFSGRCLKKLSEEERKWYGRPKWKHVAGRKPHGFIWGGIDEIEGSGRAIVVESIGDSLSLRQAGMPESIVLFGATLSQAVLGKLIALNPNEIIVATNRDIKAHMVGQKAAAKIEGILRQFFNADRIRVVLPDVEGKKDWGEYSAEELENLKNLLDTPPNSLTME